MRLGYLGHSCFVVEAGGHKLLLDPYEGGAFPGFDFRLSDYSKLLEGVEGVAITHHHADHDFLKPFPRLPVFDGVAMIGKGEKEFLPGFQVAAYKTDHGPGRGACSAISVRAEGKKLVHLGDTFRLPEETASAIRGADYLLIPVGGLYTVGPSEARDLALSLSPRFVVPMHYAVRGKSTLVPHGLDDFLSNVDGLSVLVMNPGSIRELP